MLIRNAIVLTSKAGGSLLALMLTAMCAFGDSTSWTFGAGNYSWGGGSADLIGDVQVLSVTDVSNNNKSLISNGLLHFETGAYNGTGSNWQWLAGSNQVKLSGCIAGVTTDSNCANNVLLSGSFIRDSFPENTDVFLGVIAGTVNSNLATNLGMSDAGFSGNLRAPFITSSAVGSAFTGTPAGGSIAAQSVSVAESWSVMYDLTFLGSVITILGMGWRFGILRSSVL